ncbi:MAG TPA: diguanylate cyclase [Chitinispirillaceae bacterium]|nr:diguanylate cyclase [Chitinispirillaceae bacterium]
MENSLYKKPSDCQILIVDDEELTCDLLRDSLEPAYKVWTCNNGTKAFQLMDEIDFDLVVTDLKLPDVSGIDVLSHAKGKDEFTEVIVITGYASVDSATLAINLGVYSYLEKPLSITDFLIQVQKAIASRMFHLKSIRLMHRFDDIAPDDKDHLSDITSLYYFTRKLMLSLEIPEIMRITLEEVNLKINAVLSVINVNILGFREMFAMPRTGSISQTDLESVFQSLDVLSGGFVDKKDFTAALKSSIIYKGKNGSAPDLVSLHTQSIPLVVTDHVIGSLTVFFEKAPDTASNHTQFLYVFTSMVSSIIEHGYSALQARQQAKTDSLTGIANHRMFQESLDREISRANRKKGFFGLILIDIDNFKKVNDTWGHLVGDAVIIDLTKRVGTIIRVQDTLARYGGEEFGIILPETDLHGTEILAQRVLHEVACRPLQFSQQELSYTVSIGVAIYDSSLPMQKNQLISIADDALYASKRNGKNQVSIGETVV